MLFACEELGKFDKWFSLSIKRVRTFKSNNMAKDKCVMCGEETPYEQTVHIDYRAGYIEGAGQLCNDCYTGNTTLSIPRSMVKNTPNDQELGEKIREMYWETRSGGYADLESYQRGKSKY